MNQANSSAIQIPNQFNKMHNIGNGNRSLVYDGKIAGLYDLEETLGSGHFAVVKLARHVFTGEKVAVKVIDKTKLDEVSRAHLFQEVRCMKLVQHPNVVRLYEVIDTQTKLYLILELGDGGDLYDNIMKHEGGLSENLAREYFRQIVRAISYCHKLHVVHRDLKPENVVFFEKLGVVKLTDFGFSNKFYPGQKLETSCGSLAYSAPEILLGDSYDAPAVDIWSLGVILYMLVCGQPPFEKANDSETLTMIMDCKYTMPPHVSQECRKLIGTMLVRAPENRATLEQIAQDPWLTECSATSIQSQDSNIPEFLPLVSRQQVSDEDHTTIIKKMVNGSIATKEEILEALDRNEYNHITATYFLMAERKLRQQRLDQAQKRRPELSLPVSSTSQLSPRSRIQGIKNMQSHRDTNNQLIVPSSSQLSAPRTPGGETTTAGGRTRKCSIVQEEEDDEDEIPNCTNRDELTAPLNRRGSRSEGRINLAMQDKVSQHDRVKLNTDNKSNQLKGIENIAGIKVINNDANNIRKRLGMAAGSGATNYHRLNNYPTSSPPLPPVQITDVSGKLQSTLETIEQSSNSLGQLGNKNIIINHHTDIDTKYLVDSSTITLPIVSNTTLSDSHANMIPKYKTMPSPTRPSVILSGPRPLNEIFEEGTDIGSSDTSATTTPRPVTRSAHFTTNRGGGSNSTAAHQHHHHRRTKFHKTRTPSCSSSDASDDDSESRKKRAHKMPDISKPLQPQRRDSHDDSSDSQDPSNNALGGGGGGNLTNVDSTYLICTTSNGKSRDSADGSNTGNNGRDGGSGSTRDTSLKTTTYELESNCCPDDSFILNEISRQKTEQQQPLNYRRHRNGRRRASETRLRESQSLNRITEVQESEMPTNSNINNQTSQPISNAIENNQTSTSTLVTVSSSEDSVSTTELQTTIKPIQPTKTPTNPSPVAGPTKPKGFSARLFHGFKRQRNNDSKNLTTATAGQDQQIGSDSNSTTDDVDMMLGVEFTKAIRVTETSKTSSATKKLKMLGKYFQVHKKICIPLPGLFQRATGGRLYKAQSCGSIVHNRLNQNVVNTSTNPPSTISSNPTRHSVAGSDNKTNNKILKNCLGGAKFLNSSDSNINKNHDNNLKIINNNSSNNISTASLFLQHLSTSSANVSLSSLCSSPSQLPIFDGHNITSTPPTTTTLIKPSTFDLMSATSATMTTTLLAAQNNCNIPSSSKFCNNLANSNNNNSKILTTSPLHHQLNDVPLCSSKC